MEEKTRLWLAPYDASLRVAQWEPGGGGLLSLFLGRLSNFLLISRQLSHGGRGERRKLRSGGSSLSNPSAALRPPPFLLVLGTQVLLSALFLSSFALCVWPLREQI